MPALTVNRADHAPGLVRPWGGNQGLAEEPAPSTWRRTVEADNKFDWTAARSNKDGDRKGAGPYRRHLLRCSGGPGYTPTRRVNLLTRCANRPPSLRSPIGSQLDWTMDKNVNGKQTPGASSGAPDLRKQERTERKEMNKNGKKQDSKRCVGLTVGQAKQPNRQEPVLAASKEGGQHRVPSSNDAMNLIEGGDEAKMSECVESQAPKISEHPEDEGTSDSNSKTVQCTALIQPDTLQAPCTVTVQPTGTDVQLGPPTDKTGGGSNLASEDQTAPHQTERVLVDRGEPARCISLTPSLPTGVHLIGCEDLMQNVLPTALVTEPSQAPGGELRTALTDTVEKLAACVTATDFCTAPTLVWETIDRHVHEPNTVWCPYTTPLGEGCCAGFIPDIDGPRTTSTAPMASVPTMSTAYAATPTSIVSETAPRAEPEEMRRLPTRSGFSTSDLALPAGGGAVENQPAGCGLTVLRRSRGKRDGSLLVPLFVVGVGKQIALMVDLDCRLGVSSVKQIIHSKRGIAPDSLWLTFGAKILREGSPLSEYGITPNSSIHLSLRLRGGSDGPPMDDPRPSLSAAADLGRSANDSRVFHPTLSANEWPIAPSRGLAERERARPVNGASPSVWTRIPRLKLLSALHRHALARRRTPMRDPRHEQSRRWSELFRNASKATVRHEPLAAPAKSSRQLSLRELHGGWGDDVMWRTRVKASVIEVSPEEDSSDSASMEDSDPPPGPPPEPPLSLPTLEIPTEETPPERWAA